MGIDENTVLDKDIPEYLLSAIVLHLTQPLKTCMIHQYTTQMGIDENTVLDNDLPEYLRSAIVSHLAQPLEQVGLITFASSVNHYLPLLLNTHSLFIPVFIPYLQ
jgi:hypothetical protein